MIYNFNQRKIILLGIIAFLGIFIIYALKDFFTSFIGAVIIYTLFKPLYVHLTEKRKWNQKRTALLIIIISFFILLLPLFSLTWMLVGKIINFKNHPGDINEVIDRVDQFMGVNFNQPDLVPNALNKIENWVAGTFPSAVFRVLHVLLQVIVMYFMMYFMFINRELFENTLVKYIPVPENNTRQMAAEFRNITYATVLGQGLIAISQGVLFIIGFWIFKIPDPLFWGIVIMLFAFIPLVGPPAIIIPAALILISSGRTFAGVGIIVYSLVLVTTIEYFLRFYVSDKIGKIHPIIVILGLIIGLPIFGILGLVIGPMIVSFFVLLIMFYETNYVKTVAIKRKRGVEVEE